MYSCNAPANVRVNLSVPARSRCTSGPCAWPPHIRAPSAPASAQAAHPDFSLQFVQCAQRPGDRLHSMFKSSQLVQDHLPIIFPPDDCLLDHRAREAVQSRRPGADIPVHLCDPLQQSLLSGRERVVGQKLVVGRAHNRHSLDPHPFPSYSSPSSSPASCQSRSAS